ncbi:MAG: S-layer homology domain-containing protein [Armatimonadetes bacterium]|nr:S-layer homology domain-containing protein [Armatimonadota bacterium]
MNRLLKTALITSLSAGLVMPAAAQSNFPDVPDNHWAYEALANLKGSVLFGYPDGLYRPSRPMSRAEFAVAINNLYSLAMGKMAGLSDQVNALDAYVKSLKTGATEEQMDELFGQIRAIRRIPDIKSLRADTASLMRLAKEFEKEMASFGVDVNAMQQELENLAGRVTRLEERSNSVNISGDLIFVGLAGHSTNGLWGLTKTGRIAGRKNFMSAGMDKTFQMYHNFNFTFSGQPDETTYWKASLNSSNAYSYDTLLDNWNRAMFGMPYGEPEITNFWFDEANMAFDTSIANQNVDVTVGRFYHSSGAFFLARPHYAEFYENPRVNNGQHVFDGVRTEFAFGNTDLTILLARVDDLKYTDGNDFTSLTGESLFGLELEFQLGADGRIKGVHYWEQDNDTDQFVGAGEDRMRTYGAQIDYFLDDFSVAGSFSQTDYYLGDSSVLSDDNTAASVSIRYDGGGTWGATGLYSMVEGNFGAQGSWGRLGPYFNPANIDVYGAEVWFDVSDRVGLRGSWKRYRPADAASMGAFGIMMGDDRITAVDVALDIDLNDRLYMSLGWENADGSLLGGDPVGLNWYSVDFNYAINGNAEIAVHYLFSDGRMPVTYGGITNKEWRGGILAFQATLRF